jgi:hypothetical protein
MTNDPVSQLEQDLRSLFPEWRRWASFGQGRVPMLIENHGATGAIKHLLRKPGLSRGFVALRDAGRLDLTIEFLVLRKEFGSLFSAEERGIARRRLTENGMPRSELPLEPY